MGGADRFYIMLYFIYQKHPVYHDYAQYIHAIVQTLHELAGTVKRMGGVSRCEMVILLSVMFVLLSAVNGQQSIGMHAVIFNYCMLNQ